MDSLINFLDHLVASGDLSSTWIAVCLAVAGCGVLLFYLSKSLSLLVGIVKQYPSATSTQPDQASSIKTIIQDENKYVLKVIADFSDDFGETAKAISTQDADILDSLRDVESEIQKLAYLVATIKDNQAEEIRVHSDLHKDLNVLVAEMSESTSKYNEMARQIQTIQVDIASLHGTIIGLNTQRARLK